MIKGCLLLVPTKLEKVLPHQCSRVRLLTVPTSTAGLPFHEDWARPGSLFASRTLPPLPPHPYPRPRLSPLLPPFKWLHSSPFPPLTTIPSEDRCDRE